MKSSIRRALTGAATLVIAGSVVVAAGGTASAAAPTAPFDPSQNGATQGSLSFYDASGNLLTSGTAAQKPAYVMANNAGFQPASGTPKKATVFAATPVKGQNPFTWPIAQISTASDYPPASLPASLQGKPNAINSTVSQWFDPDTGYQGPNGNDLPNQNTDPAWQNYYQLRMAVSSPSSPPNAQVYASATVYVDAQGNWEVTYPVAASTTTTVTANPASPKTNGPGNVTFTATVSPTAAAGTVQFKVNGSTAGSPVNVNNGQATLQEAVDCGTSLVEATFIPADPGSYAGSSGQTNYVVKGGSCPVTATNTSVSANPASGNAFQNVTLTAVVRTGATQGSGTPLGAGDGQVVFTDSVNGNLGQANVGNNGIATISYNQFGPGAHTVTATFTPADPTTYSGSNGQTGVTYDAAVDNPCNPYNQDGSRNTQVNTCVDPQTVKVTVRSGELSITTPYTPSNPFDLGNMTLDPNNTSQLIASRPFPGAGQVIAVNDTRAGNLGWTASVQTTDFTSPVPPATTTPINGDNLSLTGVATVNPTNAAGPFIFTNATQFKGSAKPFANAAVGGSTGTTSMQGTLSLFAPSSTNAGTYTGTVTFTVA